MNLDPEFSFPLEMTYKSEEIREKFWKCLYTSTGQEMFHYWVLLPQAVKPAEVKPVHFPEVGLTNIGRYITEDTSPYMEVWAAYERCQWEMNPSDWLENKLSLMGEKILHQRLINHPSGSGKFADVLTIKTLASGDEVVSRYTVQKDYNPVDGGGNYFLIKASCAAAIYNSLANDIHFIAINWDLQHRSNMMLAELLKTVSLSSKNSSGFKVPDSWQVNVIADNRLVIEHTFDGVNYGVINLCFYSQEKYKTAEEVFQLSTSRFHQHDNAVSLTASAMETVQNDINSAFTGDVYTCTGEIVSAADKVRAFYQMYIVNVEGLWCYAESVGKHRNHQDYYHEANKRCLEIILSTLHIENA